MRESRMNGAFRKPGDIRDRARTGTDGTPFGSCRLGVKVKINEIRRRFLVVTSQIAHQHIDDIIINENRFFEARIAK